MKADLAFYIECERARGPNFESRLTVFLESRGFRVLDLEAIRGAYGEGFNEVDIEALDLKDREVRIYKSRTFTGTSVALYTRPPTQHDAGLEGALLGFSESLPGCHSEQITRGDNRADTLPWHKWEVSRVEGLFKEAKVLSVVDKCPVFRKSVKCGLTAPPGEHAVSLAVSAAAFYILVLIFAPELARSARWKVITLAFLLAFALAAPPSVVGTIPMVILLCALTAAVAVTALRWWLKVPLGQALKIAGAFVSFNVVWSLVWAFAMAHVFWPKAL